MAAPPQKSKEATQCVREIDSLLKRLHSGCRFIHFEDDINKHDISNVLRNAAHPDEVHSELGRALAHSYMTSLLFDDDEVIERILTSLCCGEDIDNGGGSGSSSIINNNTKQDRANYASTANAFFSYLKENLLASNKNLGSISEHQIHKKWLQMCVRCEELVFTNNTAHAHHNDNGLSYYSQNSNNGGGRYVLTACFKHYASISFGNSLSSCDSVYKSLQKSTSRKQWIRFISTALESVITKLGGVSDEGASAVFQNYYLLFEVCVVQTRRGKIPHNDDDHVSYNEEKRLILNELLRICTMSLRNDRSSICIFTMKVIETLAASLVSYLDQLAYTSSNSRESVEVLELSYDWLRGLSDLIMFASSKNLNEVNTKHLTTAIDTIILTIIPQLSSSTSMFPVSYELTSIYATIESSINSIEQYSSFGTVNSVAAMRLGTLALSLTGDEEVNALCDLLLSIFTCLTDEDNTPVYSDVSFVGGILYSVGCIFSSRPSSHKAALMLRQVGEKLIQRSPTTLDNHKNGSSFHLLDLLSEVKSEPYQQLIDVISESISDTNSTTKLHSWRRRPLTLEDQYSGLLLGLTLLHVSVMSPSLSEYSFSRTLEYLGSFLECYPRAASRVVPSVLNTIRMSSHPSSSLPQVLSNSLKFVASKYIVSDPHGAHLAWAYLSPLATDGVPAATRATIIRVLPHMCLHNKRLFRRIRDVIGRSIISTDPMVRIAATATLADMAKLDLLRDVESIVSWIQGRLNDEEPAVTSFALMTLRYLVENEELDFDLVVRVLEKRLGIDFDAIDEFLNWDTLVLESFVQLLGEGGLEEEEDDDESEDEEKDGGGKPEPTAKTVKAVTLLIDLALQIKNLDERFDLTTKTRLISKIYQSLTKYSALVLGLDPESIRSYADSSSVPEDLIEDWERYIQLKTLSQGGLELIRQLQDEETKEDVINAIKLDFNNSLVAMLQLLIEFEEEAFGSFLLRKGSSSSKGKNEGVQQHRISKLVLSALPEISAIKSIFESDESASARAAAYLYALAAEDDNSDTSTMLAEMTECIAYFSPPADDPPAYAVQIFSIMNAMAAIFRSVQNAEENARAKMFNTAIDKIEEWVTEFTEYGYVALAALALSADDDPQFFPGITRVLDTILDSVEMFETVDIKLLCVCMVATRLSRTTDARVVELMDSVDKSLVRHDGMSCVGGYIGLAIFVQNMSNRMRLTGSDASEVWCREQALRCISVLVKGLNNSIQTQDDSILDLITCIKIGMSTDGFTMPSNPKVNDGAGQKLRGVIIGLSHCFSTLAAVSTDLLKAVVALIEELPWSSGKGFAMNSAYKALIDAGEYSQDDLADAITTTSAEIEGLDNDCLELSDALFSLVSLSQISSGKLKEESDFIKETMERIQSSTSQMSRKGKTMAMLTYCASIGEVPGITSFVPNIHSDVKKGQVANVVKILEDTLLNGELESTHASALALGVLCSMRNASQIVQRQKHDKKSERKDVDVNSIIQGKDGSVMEFVLHQVGKAHSIILSPGSQAIVQKCASEKLCILFKALEAVALPGSFSRVIETTLYSTSATDVTKLTDSSLRLLFSQIECGRRRIGFDGRGFLDLTTRLTKLTLEDLHKLIGASGTQLLMAAIPNLLFQLPTSAGEEVAKHLWCICRDLSNHEMIITEFFNGMKIIFASAGKETKDKSKLSTSPALLRALQNLVASGLFAEFCDVAAQTSRKYTSSSSSPSPLSSSYSTIISAYLDCLTTISASATTDGSIGYIQSEVSLENILVMASCASLSSKRTRRVETWIARQDVRDNDSSAQLRMLLLSSLAVAPHSRNDIEMKESIVNLFDIMLVISGTHNTVCMELIAAKVAYWWDSTNNMNGDTSSILHPIHRVSTMSSFFVSNNLCSDVQMLSNKELTALFDLFVSDLPTKLALLCHMWKISDDISNRTKRLLKDASDNNKIGLEKIILLLEGGN